MTTKKELRTRVDLHTAEITQLYQQLDLAQSATNKLQQTADLHTQQLAEWRTLFENTQSAVCKIRELADAAADRENNRQAKFQTASDEISARLDKVAEIFCNHDARLQQENKSLKIRIDALNELTFHNEQRIDKLAKQLQENQTNAKRPHTPTRKLQRKPAPKQTAKTKTATAPTKAKLPTSPRAKRPAAQR